MNRSPHDLTDLCGEHFFTRLGSFSQKDTPPVITIYTSSIFPFQKLISQRSINFPTSKGREVISWARSGQLRLPGLDRVFSGPLTIVFPTRHPFPLARARDTPHVAVGRPSKALTLARSTGVPVLLRPSSMDAKDILGLQKASFPSAQEKKSRPPKEPQRKPDGVSREVPPFVTLPALCRAFGCSPGANGCCADLGVRAHRRGGNGAAHADHRGLAPEAPACRGEGEGGRATLLVSVAY